MLLRAYTAALHLSWAARYNTGLLIKLTPKAYSFLFFFSFLCISGGARQAFAGHPVHSSLRPFLPAVHTHTVLQTVQVCMRVSRTTVVQHGTPATPGVVAVCPLVPAS